MPSTASFGDPAAAPTPTPDPVAIMREIATNLRRMQTARFDLTHDPGSIYVSAFSARITAANGAWSAEQGAEFTTDIYVVADHEADIDSGAYFQLKAVVTPDSYYGTDPFSGAWTKQPLSLIPIPVADLNEIMAVFVESIDNPTVDGLEETDGLNTYRITGSAPATVMDWLLLHSREDQRVQVEVWTDVDREWLRKARITGPIGRFDHPDTVREIRLYDINEPLTVQPPVDYIDLTAGQ